MLKSGKGHKFLLCIIDKVTNYLIIIIIIINNNNLFIKCLLYNRLRLSKSAVQDSCCIKT